MAITPPDEFNDAFGSTNFVRLSEGKQRKGYNVGETPGVKHMNHVIGATSTFQAALAKSMAAQIAYVNMDYTATVIGPTTNPIVDMHVDYNQRADRWYAVGVDSAGLVFVTDSDDGITWGTPLTIRASGGTIGDTTKVASDGTVIAVVGHNGIGARMWASTDLTVANLADQGYFGTISSMTEASDMVYDGTYWICCGRDSTLARVYTATDPTGTFTRRTLSGVSATNAISLATDGSGRSWLGTSIATETYYTSSPTGTWTLSTTDPAIANNVVWSDSLQLFVIIDNANGYMWTSEDGVNWTDMNLVEGVPALTNLVHCEDFVIGWSDNLGPSTNGLDYYDVYAFFTEAIDRSNFNYMRIGQAWQDNGVSPGSIPLNDASEAIYGCGQGKMIFPYYDSASANDARIMVAYYGAPDAF